MTASDSRTESGLARSMREHYGGYDDARHAHLVETVMDSVDAIGSGPLSAAQLASLDQFHVRGLVATAELARMTGFDRSSRVLDAGSGLGGPARFLAETYGCLVTGVDLSPAFVELSRELSRRSPVADRVRFEMADLCALPFGDRCFDRVWTQHVLMNVHERSKAYAEFRRVLSTGGRLAFYDAVAADDRPDLIYPVPWASRHELSHLLTQAETEAALLEAGFVRRAWNDVTSLAMNWFGQQPTLARIIEDRLLAVNLVLGLEVAAVGSGPVPLQAARMSSSFMASPDDAPTSPLRLVWQVHTRRSSCSPSSNPASVPRCPPALRRPAA